MMDKIIKKDFRSRIMNIGKLLERLRISWYMIMEFPIKMVFWEKVFLLFRTTRPGKPVNILEAMQKSETLIEHYQIAFWYSLKAISVIDIQMEDHKQAESSVTWSAYESKRIHSLIADFAGLKISRALKSTLESYEGSNLNKDARMRLFKTKLLNTVYTTYDGIKHEEDILSLIEECIKILSSVSK